MKNIPHLEDLAFYANPSEIKELMAALIFKLQGHKVGELTIKFDGAPALVFGKDEQGLFVATKGYYNKARQLYRSLDEIEDSNRPQGVKDKLFMLYELITGPGSYIPGSTTYFGDFLFMNGYEQEASRSFKPNIIEYTSDYIDLSRFKMGIAIHGVEFCGGRLPEMNEFAMASHGPPARIYQPDVRIKVDGLLEGINLSPYLNMPLYTSEIEGDEAKIKTMRKWMNTLVKENHNYTRRLIKPLKLQELDNIENNLHTLVAFKELVLFILNRGKHNTFPHKMYLNGAPTTHEGYVFRYKDFVVKLVDRFVFSKANFDESTPRGWSK
jgi:hypothetical protein